MEPVKKIEIIANSLDLEKISDALDSAGVSGYTVIRNALGKGDRGTASDDLETTLLSNVYVIAVCSSSEQANKVASVIKPILEKFGGVCLVSDAQWVTH